MSVIKENSSVNVKGFKLNFSFEIESIELSDFAAHEESAFSMMMEVTDLTKKVAEYFQKKQQNAEQKTAKQPVPETEQPINLETNPEEIEKNRFENSSNVAFVPSESVKD